MSTVLLSWSTDNCRKRCLDKLSHYKPVAWLDKERAIPIRDDEVWNTLSFTKGIEKTSAVWTGKVRASLNQLQPRDGQFLEKLILAQAAHGKKHPLDEREYQKFVTHTVRRLDKVVAVTVPQDTEVEPVNVLPALSEVRESIKIQAILGTIGA